MSSIQVRALAITVSSASDFRRRAFLHYDRAGHSGADQHTGWDVRQIEGLWPRQMSAGAGEKLRTPPCGAVTAKVGLGSIVYVAGLAAVASAHVLGAAAVLIGDMNKGRRQRSWRDQPV
jgi:hypothetical protein